MNSFGAIAAYLVVLSNFALGVSMMLGRSRPLSPFTSEPASKKRAKATGFLLVLAQIACLFSLSIIRTPFLLISVIVGSTAIPHVLGWLITREKPTSSS
jgi:hypothetical protein